MIVNELKAHTAVLEGHYKNFVQRYPDLATRLQEAGYKHYKNTTDLRGSAEPIAHGQWFSSGTKRIFYIRISLITHSFNRWAYTQTNIGRFSINYEVALGNGTDVHTDITFTQNEDEIDLNAAYERVSALWKALGGPISGIDNDY